jgi:hypothetical protein
LPSPAIEVALLLSLPGAPANISRVSPDGRLTTRRFVEGGREGATLNAPKGLAIVGRELFVADIDVVRSFDRITGERD